MRGSRVVWTLLAVVLIVGLGIRLYGLDTRGFTHVEMYVPRIDLPAYAQQPPARHTVWAIVETTVAHDNHPPAYYLLMWVWTFFAGTSLFAIRLPSVLFGVATIGLLFVVARRRYGVAVALTSAALLAVHGHHVFWSQWARMWVLIALLGVVSVALLQHLARRWHMGTALAYAAVSALGLWTDYNYWPFFLGQIVWALIQDAEPARAPRIVGAQLVALVLSGPLLVMLRIQLYNQPNYLHQPISQALLELAGFARLFPYAVLAQSGSAGMAAFYALAMCGGLLLLAAIAWQASATAPSVFPEDREAHERDVRTLLGLQAACAAAVSLLVVLAHPLWESLTKRTVLGCALAWLPVAAWWVGSRTWPRWAGALVRTRGWSFVRGATGDLVAVQVLVPLAVLSLMSLRMTVAAERGLLIFAPFLLLMMAAGLFRLRMPPLVRATVCAALVVLSAASLAHFQERTLGDPDFRTLADAVISRAEAGDVIVVDAVWWAEPIHYYLRPDRYHLVPPSTIRQLQAEGRCSPASPRRVWAIVFKRGKHPPETLDEQLQNAANTLPDHAAVSRASVPGGRAVLFERPADRCREETRGDPRK